MLKVILGHRGCAVASCTKDMKQKFAQAMDKVRTIKLSMVQICFLHFYSYLRSLPSKSVSML